MTVKDRLQQIVAVMNEDEAAASTHVRARIDRRNMRSLALCDRVGLRDEYPDPHDPTLVQR